LGKDHSKRAGVVTVYIGALTTGALKLRTWLINVY